MWHPVSDWCNVINRHNEKPKNPNSILIFDSYYMTKASQAVIDKANLMFIGACKSSNWNDLTAKVEPRVLNSGEWAGIYAPAKHTVYLHRWDKDELIGKKYVLSNAFKKVRKHRSASKLVPVYDLYNLCFNACDIFNRKLHDKLWPHRYGGNCRFGESGHQHKFAFGVLLQNVFYLAEELGDPRIVNMNFEEKCYELAFDLYRYSVVN